MENLFKIENNENLEMCKNCGGTCCKRHPCDVSVYDVFRDKEPSVEGLINFLSSDLYQIDWWDGDVSKKENIFDKIFMIRPRFVPFRDFDNNDEDNLYFPMYIGRCILLTENGCLLDWNDRPTGGKALECTEPRKAKHDIIYDKEKSAMEWRNYQWLFENIPNRKLKPYKEAIKELLSKK